MLLVTHALPADAVEWNRYENKYFVADSSAGEKKTLEILRELELFRAAVVQVTNLRVPESAPKTEVLIFDSKRDFERLGYGRNVAGFTRKRGERFLIVMSASGMSRWGEDTILSGFSHVLLGHHGFPYPMWYSRGFAELMATTEIRSKKLEFTIGQAPESAKWTAGDGFSWNALIAEGWSNQSLHGKTVSSAYLQSWLLVHYAMLGDNFANVPKLYDYFRLLGSGVQSLDAFEQAFGMNGQALWAGHLKHYSQRLFYVVYEFRPEELHLDFQRTETDVEAIEALIEELKYRPTD